MSLVIDLEKSLPSSKIQPEIFRIKKRLKGNHNPDYVAILKGAEIEMVCINKSAWLEYQNYKTKKELSDQKINDGFSNVAINDFLKNEPPMTQEEIDYYSNL